MDKKKIVIVGYDTVSPLGVDTDTQWRRAANAESGIGRLTRFPVNEDFPVRIAGQVSEIDTSPYPFLSAQELAYWTSPIFKYSLLVVHRALKKSGLEITPKISPRVGITFSSALGGLDVLMNADRKMVADKKPPHPFTNPNSCVNMVGGKVSIMTKATGPISSTITACATGTTSMIIGSMFIQQDIADVVICGAADFALIESIVAGFASMNGAYKHKKGQEEPPEKASRPYSINRRGFVVSEGAGCILIASGDFAKAHGLNHNIEIAGWGMTSDAQHFVAPNLETVSRCLLQSIESAGIQPADIDAVNGHGTSTKIGDKIEVEALKNIFGNQIPPLSANKSQIGHPMGAASAIESIFAMEGMLKDTLLPTINYTQDPEIPIDCVPEGARKIEQEFVLKNAFGFGGCNSCIVFKRVK
ncbi:MAG: 3-oxoacyl-ACP synthase [Deltaproteobacteria bacterium RIFCSPLOWO2_02_FULL_50_16]|nr:MAG: 3-oxoacyl-ACP synthase [Deltaproteobacteria bacterium GWA2_50_8]OGQ28555.1 MAG: 3-oxoacyl-ACP synthase [Deltaproteobacteria bacterium RIFCSPHIGHO2_02_FULL_50_15]OGQ57157.1 MAG: 3-oxoacyl-ACP synthase [Deltaproteobacteria bacterium RIFCSPLOWO2_02_FULL_50_16]OGQ69122.1 MAG: 3-oxoacyl-ACP synthase [Deltaproteobacteria bacterium RIFCSPLOWO2_12_FULL_50_11]